MSDPGGEQVRDGDRTEGGVETAAFHVGWLEVQGFQILEVLGSLADEVFECGGGIAEGFARDGRKGLRVAVFDDEFDAGQPVVAFEIGEVANDVVRVPGVGTFVGRGPGLRQIVEECLESGGEIR
jgi:hypothetical protein